MTKTNKNIYKYENLEVGLTLKSYRHLCEVLGTKPKSGTSKMAHFKEWDRYFSYEKDGNKIIITEIYTTPKDKVNNYKANNTTKYIDKIEKLILDLIIEKGDGDYTLFISKNKLLLALNMINENYAKGRQKPNRASNTLDVSLFEIHDFFNTSEDMFQRNIETALNNLRNKAIIMWKTSITVAYINHDLDFTYDLNLSVTPEEITDEYGDTELVFKNQTIVNKYVHRKADEEDERRILQAESVYLKKYKCNDKREIFVKGYANDFYKDVRSYLSKFFNMTNYYNSYEITINDERLEDEQKNLEELILNSDDKDVTLNDLNIDIVNQLFKNTTRRHELASEKLAENNSNQKYINRSKKEYVENGEKIIKHFINHI